MTAVPPLQPDDAAAHAARYPALRTQLPGIVKTAKLSSASRGEALTFARLAHAISTGDPVEAGRIGAAAILLLAEASS